MSIGRFSHLVDFGHGPVAEFSYYGDRFDRPSLEARIENLKAAGVNTVEEQLALNAMTKREQING